MISSAGEALGSEKGRPNICALVTSKPMLRIAPIAMLKFRSVSSILRVECALRTTLFSRYFRIIVILQLSQSCSLSV